MRHQRTLSPWAHVALREGWDFGGATAEALLGSTGSRYHRLVGLALALALLAGLAGREYPTVGLVFAGLALAAALWVVKTGGRVLRACAARMEHLRRRHARARPGSPDWAWAVARAQEPSLTFGTNSIVDYRWFAVIIVSTLLILGWRNAHIGSLLGDAGFLLLPVGAGLLSLAVIALFWRVGRDRRRIRRAVFQARCIRCDYQIMRPADRRHPIHCPVCPECGYRYPLHPPPTVDRIAAGGAPIWNR